MAPATTATPDLRVASRTRRPGPPLKFGYTHRWEDETDGDGEVPLPPLSASSKAARKIVSAPTSLAEAYVRDEIRAEQNWQWI
ncbi:hypothetical protein ACCO45_005845 [Purpureocillium lilacinum]|uniref:Uncharacterized protein n=1 Tax=Purpureocillium lilacinum TaxID=33203 RepID=A0ACC4DZN2_PURLI